MVKSGKNPTTVPILSSIVTILITTEDLGLQWTSHQCLKVVFGSSVQELMEYDEFLSKIYSSTLFSRLFEPLSLSTAKDASELQFLLLQLFGLLIANQGYRFKYLLLNSTILTEGVARHLMLHEDGAVQGKKTLLLGALFILRQMIGLGDEFYNRFLVKFGRFLLDPLVDILETLSRNNSLLCSTLIDLLDEIGCRSDNLLLLSYFNRRFYKRLMALADCVPFLRKTIFFSNLKDESGESDQEDDGSAFLSDYDPEDGFLPLNLQEKKESSDTEPIWARPIEQPSKKAAPTFRFVNLSPSTKINSVTATSIERTLDKTDPINQITTDLPCSEDAHDQTLDGPPKLMDIPEINIDTNKKDDLATSTSSLLSPPKKIRFDEA